MSILPAGESAGEVQDHGDWNGARHVHDSGRGCVREVGPDAIYHLAAQSSPAESLADPWGTICNNLLGQFNLLESLLSTGQRPRVLVIGSSDEYGTPEKVPTDEALL